ncbi:MAG: hypothetical protein ACOYL6_02495 [Bacteriovoracaceae bacterium]|jgi:hypothetical protein
MGISKLTNLAALLAMIAVSTGQLPRILKAVQLAQLHLIKDSRASTWGRAILLADPK